ncbi:ABC transporter permease [Clostridium sp.]|uniref:ABC transporter permease n=1 Tax=Clostridium sp. TaxID=1506 RepID=UPI003464E558
MSNLKILLKNSIMNNWGINKFLKEESKSERVKNVSIILAILLGIFSVGMLIVMYSLAIADQLGQYGYLSLILMSAIIFSTMFSFFTSVYKAQGVLFSSRDFETLMSLPIKPSIILASKMIELLLLNYLFVALVTIPPAIVYFMKANSSIVFFFYLLIGIVFIPLIPIVMAAIIAFALSYISSRMKHKALILNIGTLMVVVIVVIGSFKIDKIINMVIANSASIIEGIKTIYPPSYYFTDALANLNLLSMVKLILWSIIPFILFLIVFGRSFKSINLRLGETFKKSNYKLTTLKTNTLRGALIKKEFKRYFSSSIYVTNTIIGIVLVTVAAVACLIMGGDFMLDQMAQSSDTDIQAIAPLLKQVMQFTPLILLSFGVGLTCTTGSAISIEGKNLWILKSSPLEAKDIFISKIAVNIILLVPAIIFDTVMLAIAFDLTLINFMWTILIPTLLAILVSVGGLLINLYFPKLDWTSEVQVVKQSLSSMISILMGGVLVAVIIFVTMGINKVFAITNVNLYLGAIALLLFLLILLVYTLLKTKGEKLFNRLSS